MLGAAPQAAAAQDTITVFAAASLRNALDDADAAFGKASGIAVTASYAASSALAKQIEQGAPADVFVSADVQWMDYAVRHKLVMPQHAPQPARQPPGADRAKDVQARSCDDRQGFRHRRTGGRRPHRGRQCHGRAGRPLCQGGAGRARGLAGRRAKLAQAENVRAALAYVARGETPIGIVYATDAQVEPGVKVVGVFPESSHPPIVYPVAAVAAAASKNAHVTRYLAIPADAGRQGDLRALRLQLPRAGEGIVSVLALTPQDWTAIALSLRIALVATAVALPFGIAIATLLARKQFWGKTLVDAIVYLPLVLPPVVTGYLLLVTLGRRAPVGAFLADHFGIVFSFRWTGAAISCGVMAFPLMVRAIRLSIEAIDRKLEDAAATLGARPAWVFRHRDAAAGAARRDRRRHAGLCARARRIRRHHHFRFQHPRRDADHLGRDLHADASAGRRCRRAAIGRRRRHHLARRA